MEIRTKAWMAAALALAVACGDSGDDSGPAQKQSSLDPAPDKNEPGEYGCTGSPDTGVSTFELNAGSDTTQVFEDVVQDADGNGVFYVRGSDGQEVAGAIATDPTTGAFRVTAPLFCGEQIAKCVWSNEAGSYVLVVRITTEDCIEADIRATVTWDALGDDWELHLIKPGGRINDQVNKTDCTWTTCISSSPDWGVAGDSTDDPKKDIDNTGAYGPENIFLAKPESGIYTVMVEHWGPGDPSSDGRVILNVAGKVYVVEKTDLVSQHVWTAATIDWPSGEVTTHADVFDCTANWAGGCTAPIP